MGVYPASRFLPHLRHYDANGGGGGGGPGVGKGCDAILALSSWYGYQLLLP